MISQFCRSLSKISFVELFCFDSIEQRGRLRTLGVFALDLEIETIVAVGKFHALLS
jgi:hypothetical protein